MADTQVPTQPVNVAPAAPATTPAPPTPPNIAVPAPAPVDVTSGTPQPNQATAIAGSMAPYLAKENEAAQKAADIANAPVVPPNAPHARLFNIIAAIGAGLSASGTAIATHGKEGGAPEVQEIMGARQQQQQSKVAAAQAQRDAQIRQQQTIADTNARLANNVMLMATLPTELSKRDLDNQTEAQALAENKANFAAQHGGMNADEFNAALSGTGPATGTLGGQVNPFFKTTADQQYQAASKILGTADPYVQALGKALADPNATPKDLWTATQRVQQQQALQEKATDAQVKKTDLESKQQAADPLFKYESDPKALVEPGAQQALKAYIDDPKNAGNLDGIAKANTLITKAGIAQQHAIALDAQKAQANKNAEQAAAAGDPKLAGQMLAEGGLTLADLKSRGSTPKQILDATAAAQDYAAAHGFKYNAADEVTGEQILKGAGAQTFFGSARSLVQPSGMLDMLKAAHDKLGNQKIPVLNSIADWTNYQAGTPELAGYKAAVLGAADDYAKVMSGSGTPSDTKFIATEDSFINDMNNKQFDTAIKATRDNVKSQVSGRIAGNRYIQQREGDIVAAPPAKLADYPRPTTVSPAAKLMQALGHDPVWVEPANQKAAAAAGGIEVQ